MFVLDLPSTNTIDVDWLEEALPGGGDIVTRTVVGYMSDTQEVVSVAAALAAMVADPDCYELVFFVSKSDPVTDDMYQYWDGSTTKHFINDQQERRRIMSAVLGCVDALIDRQQPSSVFMSVNEPNLPDKALVKYTAINGLFAAKGYHIDEQPPHNGRSAWVIRRHAN